MNIPCLAPYGDSPNAHVFTDSQGNLFYFSYITLVAFRTLKTGLVCLENSWSTTTGKHLNWIEPDKKARVDYEEFNRQLEFALGK